VLTLRAYTASEMGSADELQVWIGLVGVIPREGCSLLPSNEGAFVNFLTLASNESEYCAKVTGVLLHYCLELLEFEDVRPFSPEDKPSPEICQLLLSWKRTGIPSM
jgi:hypothetical protein